LPVTPDAPCQVLCQVTRRLRPDAKARVVPVRVVFPDAATGMMVGRPEPSGASTLREAHERQVPPSSRYPSQHSGSPSLRSSAGASSCLNAP
jgi:hypothetical protein